VRGAIGSLWVVVVNQGRNNGKKRYAMGDKGKKDKDKARKQKLKKQEQTAKKILEKLPTKTPA